MRIKSAGKCALTLAPVALALAVPVQAYAAEGDSWLCKYFPKYCGSETDPGGLPGHAAPDSGESEFEPRYLRPIRGCETKRAGSREP